LDWGGEGHGLQAVNFVEAGEGGEIAGVFIEAGRRARLGSAGAVAWGRPESVVSLWEGAFLGLVVRSLPADCSRGFSNIFRSDLLKLTSMTDLFTLSFALFIYLP